MDTKITYSLICSINSLLTICKEICTVFYKELKELAQERYQLIGWKDLFHMKMLMKDHLIILTKYLMVQRKGKLKLKKK